MKINWSFIEPVRDQAARLRGDFTAKSEIVKLTEQQAEIDALKELIRDLAGDLEEEIYTRYGENGRKCMPDRYERDMQSVFKAREILGETK